MRRAFALSALLFCLTRPSIASTITGVLVTEDGTMLAQVPLVLRGASGVQHLLTTLGGRFEASGLAPGEYTIEANVPGLVGSKTAIVAAVDPPPIRVVLRPAPIAERVVVSATRGDAASSTLGTTVTVISGEEIDARRPTSLLPLLQEVPGVSVARAGAIGRQASTFVRGGESNFARVMVDGIVLNTPGGSYDFGDLLSLDLSRIEVVRGAGSSLYGSDALGGIVNLVTRDPEGAPDASLEAQGGNMGFKEGRLGAHGRAGIVGWRGSAIVLKTDNQEPNGAFRETSVGGTASVALGERSDLRAMARASKSRAGTPGQTLYGRPDLDASFERDDVLAGATLRARNDAISHTARLSLSDSDQLSLNPKDSGSFVPRYGERVAPFEFFDFPDPFGFQNNTRRATAGYQAELQATPNHVVTVGAEVERETGALGNRGDAASILKPSRTNVGAYAQDRLAFGGTIFATLGARFERNESYGGRLVPRAAAAWRVRSGSSPTTLRASAGAGINEPSFFHTFGLPTFTRPNPDLKPERSRTFDLGIEQRIASAVRVEATVFRHEYRDQIAFRTVDPVTFEGAYFNIGRTRAKGIEVAVEAAAGRSVTLRGAYTRLDARIVESANEFNPLFANGKPLLKRPRHQASLFARVNHGRFDVSVSGAYVGRRPDTDFSSLGLEANDAYAKVDARAAIDVHRNASVFVALDNAFDRRYQEVLGYPALGRSFRLGIALRARSSQP